MMNLIERIEKYRFDGCVFDSLPDVAKYVENEIGKVIDSTPNRLLPKDRLAIYDAIVKHRRRLCELLSAEWELTPDELQSDTRSIFQL